MKGMGTFQELDAIPIFQSVTKWCEVVESTSSIPRFLETAFKIAVSGRPGPVYLELPEDVLTGLSHGYSACAPVIRKSPELRADTIERAVDLLIAADRPAMIIGKGVRWSEPYEELKRLMDNFGIPFITSPMGHGYLPDDHRLCYNAASSLLQANADVVLLVGARLDWTFRFGTEFARDAKLIQIDIHGQEIGVNRSATVGITGDAKKALSAMVERMALKNAGDNKERFSDWYKILDAAKEKELAALKVAINCSRVPMSPHRMLKEIRDFLPRDAITVLDGDVVMAPAQQVLQSYLPASRFTAGSNGCPGVGIPFGIGAKLAQSSRLVAVVCGDTAFGFNAMEMETAVRHKIPIVVVVVNNDGNCGALTKEANSFPACERVTMFQPDIRYEAIMRAFGGYAEFVERPEQLRPALKRAVASGTAACINVKVDPNAPYPGD
jgi:thiamine pyrophosphate-dependent acetolactate synthase large subunit-like protein